MSNNGQVLKLQVVHGHAHQKVHPLRASGCVTLAILTVFFVVTEQETKVPKKTVIM